MYAISPNDFTIANSHFFNNTANPLPWSGFLGMGGAVHVDVNHTFTPGSRTESQVTPRIWVRQWKQELEAGVGLTQTLRSWFPPHTVYGYKELIGMGGLKHIRRR